MSRLALYLLGPPRIERLREGARDGEPVQISRRKVVALLAYLAVMGTPHSRDALATLLWPERSQSRARAYLRRALSELNRTLGEGFLTIDRETAGLAPSANLSLDVALFRELLAEGETHSHPTTEVCSDCVVSLEEAVELYRDDFVAGFTLRDSPDFDEWQFFETEALRGELAGALQRLVAWHSDEGEVETATRYARRWLGLDPLHEPAHARLIALYAQAGRLGAALRQYRQCVRTLEEELGLAPSPETTVVYERVRARRARTAEVEVTATATALKERPIHLPAFLSREAEKIEEEKPVFVARERELARLEGYLDAALAGQIQVVFVTGGPGRGKTALLDAFSLRAMEAHSDLLVASGACNAYSGVGDPYLPFREVLGMLTGDVAAAIPTLHARRLWHSTPLTAQALLDHGPHLIDALVPGPALLSRAKATARPEDGRQAAGEADWLRELRTWVERQRGEKSDLEQSALFVQFTNLLRALSVQHPLLLTLDDLQWADSGSISLLFHLGRRLAGARVLIVGAYRPEEIALGRRGAQHPLEPVLAELQRHFGDVWLDLAQVEEREGRRFVDAYVDCEAMGLEQGFREALFKHTAGHPLFTVELLRGMQERGDLIQDDEGAWQVGASLDWERLPARVEAVIRARTGRLDEELRDLLAMASVEGERFTAQVLAHIQGVPERETLRLLSQELGGRHRLVREGGERQVGGGGRFVSRYRFAHALFQEYVYNGLSAGERRLLHGEVGDALEGLYGDELDEVVAHLAHHYAEAGQTEKAIDYALRAGDRARQAYANEEAMTHYQRVLDLLEKPSAPRAGMRRAGVGPGVEDRSGSSDRLGIETLGERTTGPVDERKTGTLGGLRTAFPEADQQRARRLAALSGLGKGAHVMGHNAQAEAYLSDAIALGKEMGITPRELVRLFWWLGEVMFRLGRYDEVHRIGAEGLALLGHDDESVEAALMNQTLAISHYSKGGDWKLVNELLDRTAGFIERLAYTEELSSSYVGIVYRHRIEKDVEQALQWIENLERKATPHRDLKALALGPFLRAQILAGRFDPGMAEAGIGDLRGAISLYENAQETFRRTGNIYQQLMMLRTTGEVCLALGDLQQAEAIAIEALETADTEATKPELPRFYWQKGLIFLCLGDLENAAHAFREALRLWQELNDPNSSGAARRCLAQVGMARGDPREAVKRFKRAFSDAGSFWWNRSRYMVGFFSALSGLETAYAACGEPEAYRAFCRDAQAEYARAGDRGLVQWYLEPAVSTDLSGRVGHDRFMRDLDASWVWRDPFADCSYLVENGLEIRAANGRDLWHINLSAPRLLRPAPEGMHWAVQTVCVPMSYEQPAIGGLLLWQDKENYLRLDAGTRGSDEISFQGCLENEDLVIGRGRLQVSASAGEHGSASRGPVWLRMEREEDTVRALCSADGEAWHTAGSVEFSFEGESPVQVGLHAIGAIDRTIYHGAYPDGTAIRFESFEVWELIG